MSIPMTVTGLTCAQCGCVGGAHYTHCPTLQPPVPQPPTLRQRYAMAALTGLCASLATDECSWAQMAVSAFDCADAMLTAERKETP